MIDDATLVERHQRAEWLRFGRLHDTAIGSEPAWDSVDSYDSLNLEFLNGTTLVGAVTLNGTQISSAAGLTGNGSNSAYVSVTPGSSLSSMGGLPS